ncbi:MBL fold metallo-hydrolase [Saccharopolyspora sp. NPDC002578]
MSTPILTPLTDQLFRINLAFGQCWLWRDTKEATDEVTLVDCGPPGSAPTIAAALTQLGLGTDTVARLVLTHYHLDHIGSAAEIRAWSAQVLAHPADAPVIQGDTAEPPPPLLPAEEPMWAQIPHDTTAPPCPVDQQLRHGDTVPMGDGAVVLHGPGHTPGSIALHLPRQRVLFTGDTIANLTGTPILGPFNVDRATAAASFLALADLDTDIACLGHGDPLATNAGQRLRELADLGPFSA